MGLFVCSFNVNGGGGGCVLLGGGKIVSLILYSGGKKELFSHLEVDCLSSVHLGIIISSVCVCTCVFSNQFLPDIMCMIINDVLNTYK